MKTSPRFVEPQVVKYFLCLQRVVNPLVHSAGPRDDRCWLTFMYIDEERGCDVCEKWRVEGSIAHGHDRGAESGIFFWRAWNSEWYLFDIEIKLPNNYTANFRRALLAKSIDSAPMYLCTFCFVLFFICFIFPTLKLNFQTTIQPTSPFQFLPTSICDFF